MPNTRSVPQKDGHGVVIGEKKKTIVKKDATQDRPHKEGEKDSKRTLGKKRTNEGGSGKTKADQEDTVPYGVAMRKKNLSCRGWRQALCQLSKCRGEKKRH